MSISGGSNGSSSSAGVTTIGFGQPSTSTSTTSANTSSAGGSSKMSAASAMTSHDSCGSSVFGFATASGTAAPVAEVITLQVRIYVLIVNIEHLIFPNICSIVEPIFVST